MKKLIVVHPLLFALFPILALYAYNVAEVAPSEIVLPTAIVLGSTLLLLLLSGVLLRNLKKAGILLSIFLVLFFSYGHVANAVEGWGVTYKVLLPVWVVLIVCGAYFVIRTRRDLHTLTNILNVVAVTLVIVPTITIAVHETRAASHDIKTAENMETNAVHLGEIDTLPDIYYIVLDRYASASTLKEVYDFDNSEFIDYLSDRGFYVASESRSNYLKSSASLASSLNMEYINYLSEEVGEESDDLGPMYAMLEDYEVWRFLKSRGYQFVHLGSWWEPTRENKYADMNINHCQVPEFSMHLLETTMIYPIVQESSELPDWMRAPFVEEFRVLHRNSILYNFEKLAEVPSMEGPTFVFAHMFATHEPYVFDRDGNHLTLEEANERSRTVNYVDQLIFANSKVKALLDELLSSSEVPPIIILQADEGPFPLRYELDEDNFAWEEATEAELREKMGILNAYYLPNVDTSLLYPSITPVNSFRVVFKLYFGADFELLPNKSYAFHSGRYPYKFIDVTDKVN